MRLYAISSFESIAVPPDIDDTETSSDVIVNENSDAKLICKAFGHPKPKIKWLREDKKNFTVYDNQKSTTYITGKYRRNTIYCLSYTNRSLNGDDSNNMLFKVRTSYQIRIIGYFPHNVPNFKHPFIRV